jgi:glutamate synthase domain-containing protein 1
LYDGQHEHDACGVAFVATLDGEPSHRILAQARTALRNLDHRGASGAEPDSGDGAGILVQVPDAFLRAVVDFALPPRGSYAVGLAFLPSESEQADKARAQIERLAGEEGLDVLGWRQVPVQPAGLGQTALGCMPGFAQLFVTPSEPATDPLVVDRLAYCLRKRAEHETGVYFPTLSARTLGYKGMLTPAQLESFFPDLSDERMASAIAVVHSRFSTNTFPSWPLAHPFRYIAHNGEINTARGNRNWMRAREALLRSDLIPGDLSRLFPMVDPTGSDSASFDEVLELLHLGGRSLPHAVLMMVPEAWENAPTWSPRKRAFYEFHSTLMEPWDGPACVTFTDGTQIGRRARTATACGPRAGGRPPTAGSCWPARSACSDVPADQVVAKGRLQPGRCSSSTPPRAASSRTTRSRPRWPPSTRTPTGCTPGKLTLTDPARARARRAQPRVGAAPPAGLRLHRGGAADPACARWPERRRGDRVDGHRHSGSGALRASAPAVRLLHAAVRAGDQPTTGCHPRGAGDLVADQHRSRGQPAGARTRLLSPHHLVVPGHRQRRAGEAGARQPRR